MAAIPVPKGGVLVETQEEKALFSKINWHILPLLLVAYVFAYIDRVNVGFAQLQMKQELHFSDHVFALGAGLFFVGYLIFEVPSNLLLEKIGARKTILRIMLCWGACATAMAWVATPWQFYTLRFLLGAADLAQQFAAGQVGMFVIQSLAYQPIVEVFGMQSADFGFTTLPTAGSGDPVTLAGGNVEIVNAKATEAEKVAAVEWVDYYKLEKYRSQDAAIEDAQLKADQNTAVAIPGLSPVSDEQFATYLGWIADINNVPTSNFQPYLDRAPKQTVLSEPVANAQELYAALDPVVQAVLTDENADIDALVAEAAKAVQAKLGR